MAGELRREHTGQTVRLAGWVHLRRDLGGLVFIDLRDRAGIVQISCDPDVLSDEIMERARRLGPEVVVGVEGEVAPRPGDALNPDMATGEVEVKASVVELLAPSETPPIYVAYGADDELASEELRLRYRFLDLRRPEMLRNFELRHRVFQTIRRSLDELNFVDVETPMLTRPTPEGARDYIVPSRVNPGEFYALPQSPQLYKQILMVSGFDRYFQIARCLRDEDLRADRQPEFTQLDLEMSFVGEEDVWSTIEVVMSAVWSDVARRTVDRPFARMTYRDALEKYGTDKPDLRIPWELDDLSDDLRATEFRIFRGTIDDGGRVRGFRVPGGAGLSRKALDQLDSLAQGARAAGALWTKITEDGAQGGFGSKISRSELDALKARLDAGAGDLIVAVAGVDRVTSPALDILRRHLGSVMQVIEEGDRFLWVTEFPLFEPDPESGEPMPSHHPFTGLHPDDLDLLETDPLNIRSRAYDLVYNGSEFGSGSIRINQPDLQQRVLAVLGIDAEEAKRKFGFLLEAFKYGAPPHGGFAIGLDRVVMHLAGGSSLREVIAFPKPTAARALMEGAPSPLATGDLEGLGIELAEEETDG
jgi:aspartyl-tRNA synthetase